MTKSAKKPILKEKVSKFTQEFLGIFRAIPKWIYFPTIPFLVLAGLIVFVFYAFQVDFPTTQISNHKQQINMYAFDGRTKNPSWVMEMITPENIKQNRSPITFKEDTSIPLIMRPTLADYKNSGYEIAHLLNVSNQETSKTEFDIATTSPQLPQFNQVYWAKIDNYVQELVKTINVNRVLVLTGPLFLPRTAKNGKRYVSYEVIGAGNIAVPTHFFKIIYYPVSHPDQGGFDIKADAYVIPNKNLNENVPLDSFKTSLEDIEKISGIVLPTHIRAWLTSLPIMK